MQDELLSFVSLRLFFFFFVHFIHFLKIHLRFKSLYFTRRFLESTIQRRTRIRVIQRSPRSPRHLVKEQTLLFAPGRTHFGRELFGQLFDRRHRAVLRLVGQFRRDRTLQIASAAVAAVSSVRPRAHPDEFVLPSTAAAAATTARGRVARRPRDDRRLRRRSRATVGPPPALVLFADVHHQFGHLFLVHNRHTHKHTFTLDTRVSVSSDIHIFTHGAY